MSNIPTTGRGAPTIPKPQQREVTIPGVSKQKKGNVRGGLLLIGLLLVAASVFGFWFILQNLNQRQPILVAARTIGRWEITTAADFTTVEASPGDASYLRPAQLGSVIGRWSTGTVPAGTVVTPGMFTTPPLSGETESGNVLIELTIPQTEAPFGTLQTGDRIALFGSLPTAGGASSTQLIGILRIDFAQSGKLTYIVSPEEAWRYQTMVDVFKSASNRKIWKLGTNVPEGILNQLSTGAIGLNLEEDLGVEGFGAEPLPES